MKAVLGGVCIGLSCMGAGVLLDRVFWLPDVEHQIREEMKQRYVQPVDLLPAVHQVDCSDQGLHEALELLRTCRQARRDKKLFGKK